MYRSSLSPSGLGRTLNLLPFLAAWSLSLDLTRRWPVSKKRFGKGYLELSHVTSTLIPWPTLTATEAGTRTLAVDSEENTKRYVTKHSTCHQMIGALHPFSHTPENTHMHLCFHLLLFSVPFHAQVSSARKCLIRSFLRS